jgi:pimeloyl-[acyl-carrier protein] methyl ester esterase
MEKQIWLWIRGLARSQKHWGPIADLWKIQRPNDEIIFVDIPGCGTKYQETSGFTLVEDVLRMREDFLFQMQARGLSGKVNILAVSLGGMITAKWNELYPDDIASMTIINSSSADSPIWERLIPNSIPVLLSGVRAKDAYEKEQKILSVITNTTPDLKKIIEAFAEEANKHPVSAANTMIQLWSASHFKWPKKTNETPALFLTSSADRMVSYRCSERIAKIWQAEIKVHNSAGHDLPIDEPEWVIQQTQEFLNNHPHKAN